MRLVHQMHNLARLQASDVNIALQALLHLDRRFLHCLRQHGSRALLRFLNRCLKFRDRYANLLVNGLNGGVKNELVHRDQGDCRVVRLKEEIMTRRDFRDEPLYVDGTAFVWHRVHTIASLSSCSKISRRTIANRCFDTREKSAFWIASSKVNRRSSIWRTSSP